jgi:hypothetical protein
MIASDNERTRQPGFGLSFSGSQTRPLAQFEFARRSRRTPRSTLLTDFGLFVVLAVLSIAIGAALAFIL